MYKLGKLHYHLTLNDCGHKLACKNNSSLSVHEMIYKRQGVAVNCRYRYNLRHCYVCNPRACGLTTKMEPRAQEWSDKPQARPQTLNGVY